MAHFEFGIEFPDGYWGRGEEEVPLKGWLQVTVYLNGKRYPLFFYDPVRLKQDFDDVLASGKIHYAEPGLVLLKEVTTENVRRAVGELIEEGYFDSLRGIDAVVANVDTEIGHKA